LLCRILLAAFCGWAVVHSMRIARADWLASAGTLDGLERARRVVPDNAALLARVALFRSDSGDSPATDVKELRSAARLNLLDSGLLIALGLREEIALDPAAAEADLVKAAEIDHQFKPAWTLANYYYRNNQPDKAAPFIQRMLNLEPLGFDPAPVFELIWSQNDDYRNIFRLIPARGIRQVQYLQFLMTTHRVEAALDAWPTVLAADENSADVSAGPVLAGFPDFLLRADHVAESVKVWNQLIDHKVIHAGHLDLAKGVAIADPGFHSTPGTMLFGWHLADVPGVFASGFAGSARLEISGDEPQEFRILSVLAPVIPSARYRLVWNSDGSRLSSAHDPGFAFRIVEQPGDRITKCPPLLDADGLSSCDFEAQAGHEQDRASTATIELQYIRASGTTRVSGILELTSAHLELGH
jgi:tetratricopeptide (TPR) repeat protein